MGVMVGIAAGIMGLTGFGGLGFYLACEAAVVALVLLSMAFNYRYTH
jgi:hypothetical protein